MMGRIAIAAGAKSSQTDKIYNRCVLLRRQLTVPIWTRWGLMSVFFFVFSILIIFYKKIIIKTYLARNKERVESFIVSFFSVKDEYQERTVKISINPGRKGPLPYNTTTLKGATDLPPLASLSLYLSTTLSLSLSWPTKQERRIPQPSSCRPD